MEYKGFNKDFNLNGLVSLVTGAAKGIGKAIALLLAEKGSDIILVDIDNAVSKVGEQINQMGRQSLALIYDITKTSNVEKIVKESVDKFGKIDILVNNAGISFVDDAEKLTEEAWDKIMDVNAKAPFIMSQAVGKVMIKHKFGKIINIASVAGTLALDKHAAYCASKGAVIMLTKVLALEWAEYGITVNSISPIVTLTDLAKIVWVGEVAENMKNLIPIKRFIQPEEVAASVLYLASDAANAVNGIDLMIDGGYAVK